LNYKVTSDLSHIKWLKSKRLLILIIFGLDAVSN